MQEFVLIKYVGLCCFDDLHRLNVNLVTLRLELGDIQSLTSFIVAIARFESKNLFSHAKNRTT